MQVRQYKPEAQASDNVSNPIACRLGRPMRLLACASGLYGDALVRSLACASGLYGSKQ
ncbi:hypothetical protein LF1_05970 [Rubripirellula obstinata]|uniref:Uncharacterized protein n=1 Tax=Rubripirellula obstinata TaxID=406547 RepID=A0A5B1CCZ7_9BACT|nr:hypothetical protein LF1_05970 [Rubripirellula obstinata]